MKKIFFFLLLCISCNRKVNNNDCFTLNIQPEKYQKEVLLEDIAENIEIIPLQRREDVLFGEVSYVKYYDPYYVLHDMHQTISLTVFDSQGNFVSSLQKKGQGPDEYLDIEAFDLYDNKLYVYSRMEQAFVVYSFPKMIFQEKIRINKLLTNFFVVKDYFFCVSDSEDNNAFYFNPQNKLLEELPLSFKPADVELSSSFSVKKERQKVYYISQGELSTIYELTNRNIKPSFYIDFGKNKIPEKYWNNEEAIDFEEALLIPPIKATWVQNLIMTDEQISFYYIFANPETKMLASYDINKKQSKVFYKICLYQGMQEIRPAAGTNQDHYISIIYSEDLEEIIPKGANDAKYETFRNKKDAEVFLLKYKLKNL